MINNLNVNNHIKIHQSAIQKYTTLETAKIQKACYKSLLYHEDLKMVYFSVAMAVYFWMVVYRWSSGKLLRGYLHIKMQKLEKVTNTAKIMLEKRIFLVFLPLEKRINYD